jgi:molybdopterin-guanine dinucleotide biosynthesis protein A
MFTVSGTWRGRAVGVEWRDGGTLAGDPDFCAAVRASTPALADPAATLLAAASLLADDDTFSLSGDVPALPEELLERRFRTDT